MPNRLCAYGHQGVAAVALWLGTLAGPSFAADCDGNGLPDTEDLCAGAPDADGDGYLDSCEFRYGNFDLDGDVDGNDQIGRAHV